MLLAPGTKEIDILPWMARGTLEYVSRAVLGVSLDMLDTMKSNDYADAIRAVSCVHCLMASMKSLRLTVLASL